MFRKITYRQNSIRFKRWSRKHYAVFAGLNKVISIGKISAEICEKSLQKTNSWVSEILFFNKELNNSELDENDLKFQLNEIQLLAVNSVNITANLSQQYYNCLNYIVLHKRLFFN